MVDGNFQIYGIQMNENAFASQKTESRHFYSCLSKQNYPPLFLIHTIIPQTEEITHSTPGSTFLKICLTPK